MSTRSMPTNHVGSVELEIEEEERFFDLKMLDYKQMELLENEIKDMD